MIDIPAVLRRGILLCNTPGANSVAVAEHTFALLLGYLRNVPQCDNAVRTGQWEKARTMGGEICGKTVGIIGLGNIGSRVASRMAGFEARLLGTDPCWPEALAAKYGIERRELTSCSPSRTSCACIAPSTKPPPGSSARRNWRS